MSDEEKQVLSQDEKDALKPEGQVEGEGIEDVPADADGVKAVDFTSQKRIVRGQFPVLDRIHERFTKSLANSLYVLLSKETEISMSELKVEKYDDYMCSLSVPTAICVLRYHPLRGKAMIVFDASMVYTLVDNYFGGTGQFNTAIEEREFTNTELRIVDFILKEMFSKLEEAWRPINKIKIEKLTVESNPQIVNAGSNDDVMLNACFHMKFGDQETSFNIIMPYMMLEPIREQLDIGSARSDDEIDPNWISSLRREVFDVPLELKSTLVNKIMKLSDIKNLQPGDIINITMPDEVSLEIEGVPSFWATFGKSNDKCALKITRQIEQ